MLTYFCQRGNEMAFCRTLIATTSAWRPKSFFEVRFVFFKNRLTSWLLQASVPAVVAAADEYLLRFYESILTSAKFEIWTTGCVRTICSARIMPVCVHEIQWKGQVFVNGSTLKWTLCRYPNKGGSSQLCLSSRRSFKF